MIKFTSVNESDNTTIEYVVDPSPETWYEWVEHLQRFILANGFIFDPGEVSFGHACANAVDKYIEREDELAKISANQSPVLSSKVENE